MQPLKHIGITKEEALNDYAGFVEKFKPKKTTDDCYTPPAIFEVIEAWVRRKCPQIAHLKTIRPFYPGGDYEKEDYTGRVVIDNPPFSIITKIRRFYQERGVPYFLFIPGLTAFSSERRDTTVHIGVPIEYANGAKIPTAFASNLFGDIGIIVDGELTGLIETASKKETVKIPKYEYPPNVITIGRVHKLASARVNIEIRRQSLHRVTGLDSQKEAKKAIFGKGFLCSHEVEAELRAAELRAAEERTFWALSEREHEIIDSL